MELEIVLWEICKACNISQGDVNDNEGQCRKIQRITIRFKEIKFVDKFRVIPKVRLLSSDKN